MTGAVGRHVCPRCASDLLLLPTAEGTELFDVAEFLSDDVDEQDRFVVLRFGDAAELGPNGPSPKTCLRRHRCAEPEPAPPPRQDTNRPPARADYTALHQVQTRIELYRAQIVGRLRPHPGQRRYEPVSVSARLATLGRLDTHRCSVCRRRLVAVDDTIIVGQIEGPTPSQLRACSPSCPARQQEATKNDDNGTSPTTR